MLGTSTPLIAIEQDISRVSASYLQIRYSTKRILNLNIFLFIILYNNDSTKIGLALKQKIKENLNQWGTNFLSQS